MEGTESAPIKVFSSDGSGRGVVVLNSSGRSHVSHAVFAGLKAAEFPGWSVSAAVLFYESPVTIENSSFYNNNSEDALNIIRSEFEITDCVFEGNRSDAFDSDFSHGTITGTRFLSTGNDAIDTSGSILKSSDIVISDAGDKGISIGEASTMDGRNITIRTSGIAVSSKDNSTFALNEIDLKENALAFALFQKKPEYGPTQGRVRELNIAGNDEDYLIEKGSSLEIDGRVITGNIDDVKSLLYGNVYGKITVR